jgi:hypothetical protein
VLNLKDIAFPVTLKQIKKFETANNVSINVYSIDEKNEEKEDLSILPIRLADKKMEKHINLLYLQDSNGKDGHFTWIKNLSRLVSSQLSKNGHTKYFCDRYV